MESEWDHAFVLLLTGTLIASAILIKWGLRKTAIPVFASRFPAASNGHGGRFLDRGHGHTLRVFG